jgi:hypothetical protein
MARLTFGSSLELVRERALLHRPERHLADRLAQLQERLLVGSLAAGAD